LRQRHRLAADRSDDFSIFNQKEIADTASSITTVITLLLGAIAGISLLVGGIGIMNIMLVSVTERTREIGIRIAVGARASAIKMQFLIEAITLSIFGGSVGVIAGIGTSKLISFTGNFKPVVSGGSILLAFGVSVAIGIFFGFYPATRAAALDPIDALRYE
jgi:putative ABC transport system permease protein